MKYSKFAYLIFLIAFLFQAASAQEFVDVVHLKNGSEIRGFIIEQIPGEKLRIRIQGGSELVYKMSEVRKITREKVEKPPEDEQEFKSYPELGITLGSPALVQPEFSYWFGQSGLRFSGFYWDDLFGFQLNIGIKLFDNGDVYHSISPLFGFTFRDDNVSDQKWIYLGAAYNLNLHGFFLEAGLTIGVGDFSIPQLCLKLGYSYKYN